MSLPEKMNAKTRVVLFLHGMYPPNDSAQEFKIESDLAKKAKAESLEACMASSITQAREGSLYLMCGGSEETFNRVKPILEKLSQSPRYVGPAGKAAQVRSGGEDTVVRGGQHDAADGRVVARGLEGRDQLAQNLVRKRVARVRLVESDGRDAVVDLSVDS